MVTKVIGSVFDNDFVITEANGTISREQVLLGRGPRIEAGTVLGMVTTSRLFVPLNPAGTDGSQNAVGALRNRRAARLNADTRRSVAIVRHADFNGKKLIWPAGITVNQRKAYEAQLAANSVLVRY
jgi:hypothetical protein